MASFVADALKTADVPGALGRSGMGWGDFVASRLTHPVFAAACVEIDLVVRHALLIQLEAKAATGDSRAIKLLAGGLAEIRRTLTESGVDPAGPPGSLPGSPELYSVGGLAVPAGPCLLCATGLVVTVQDDAGRFTHAVVRPDIVRSFSIPAPKDSGDLPIIWGHSPDHPHGEGAAIRLVGPDIDPAYCLPRPTGPTREEAWIEHCQRFPTNGKPAGEPVLAEELPPGVAPRPEYADRYQLGTALSGKQVWILKADPAGGPRGG